MKQELDYSTVPLTFLHCIHTQCPRANNCLRHNIMQYLAPDRIGIQIVNPVIIPEDAKDCSLFFADRKAQFALGITHLLDNVPHAKAKNIKIEMMSYLRRSTYYRIVKKERLITPGEQNFIRQLFLRYEVKEEPRFDTYVEQYEWE